MGFCGPSNNDIPEDAQEDPKIQPLTPAEQQLCSNILAGGGRKFKTVLTSFLAAQEAFRLAQRGKIERQLRLCFPDADEATIRRAAAEGSASGQQNSGAGSRKQPFDFEAGRVLLRERLKEGTAASHSAQSTAQSTADLQRHLYNLEDKYTDLRRLERSALELNDMFNYLAVLAEEQGAALDTIEANLEKAVSFTGDAVEKLEEGRVLQEQGDRWKLMMWVGAIVLGLVVIGLVCAGPAACCGCCGAVLRGVWGFFACILRVVSCGCLGGGSGGDGGSGGGGSSGSGGGAGAGGMG